MSPQSSDSKQHLKQPIAVPLQSRFHFGPGPGADSTYQWETTRKLFTWHRYVLHRVTFLFKKDTAAGIQKSRSFPHEWAQVYTVPARCTTQSILISVQSGSETTLLLIYSLTLSDRFAPKLGKVNRWSSGGLGSAYHGVWRSGVSTCEDFSLPGRKAQNSGSQPVGHMRPNHHTNEAQLWYPIFKK